MKESPTDDTRRGQCQNRPEVSSDRAAARLTARRPASCSTRKGWEGASLATSAAVPWTGLSRREREISKCCHY